jgi:hypothetical protein
LRKGLASRPGRRGDPSHYGKLPPAEDSDPKILGWRPTRLGRQVSSATRRAYTHGLGGGAAIVQAAAYVNPSSSSDAYVHLTCYRRLVPPSRPSCSGPPAPPNRANLFRSQHIVRAESTTYVFDSTAASYTVDRGESALVTIRNWLCSVFRVAQPQRPVSGVQASPAANQRILASFRHPGKAANVPAPGPWSPPW